MHLLVDARGLPCPQPVLKTKHALAEAEQVTTNVDNETARQNVTRLAEAAGYEVTRENLPEGIYLHISRCPEPSSCAAQTSRPSGGPVVLLVPAAVMGRGDDELGLVLMRSFFHTVGEVTPLPEVIVFVNTGVKLVLDDSPILDDLRTLCERGVRILACGTCLGHFGVKERVAVGEVSNMYVIAETLLGAGKVLGL